MRILLQRVSSASVTVGTSVTGAIGRGLAVFVGVGKGDTKEHADYLLEKTLNLRVFEDEQGKMNRTVREIGGGLLIVSQFTLYADVRRGRRPSFDLAAPPETARELYEYFLNRAKNQVSNVGAGVFQAHMIVQLANDGPISIFHDSIDKFGIKSHAVR
ncbi:MAG: D-tyrosyl-tRNA(Tyr) deacylase [Acidobacteria bacterium]|nr:D-tyrosyl-tRNA(Tyr) deacylase [Acidobacteriota bacterium]